MNARLAIIGLPVSATGLLGVPVGPSSTVAATIEQDYCNTQVYYCNPPLSQILSLHDTFR